MDLSVEKFEAYTERLRSKSTALKYADAARHFLDFCRERGLQLGGLPPYAMREFVAWLLEKNLAHASVHVYSAGARSYLRWCENQGLALPAMRSANMPKIPDAHPQALRGAAIVTYLQEASKLHEPFRSALLLLPYTGLRSAELVSLQMSRDIRKISFPIRGTNTHRDHYTFVVRGKGGSIRAVPLLADGVQVFASYIKNWRQHVHADSDWLFPGRDGNHIATRSLRHFIQEMRGRITNGKLTPHTLRDTYTTALWKSGVDVAVISKALGHKDMKTTFTHYLDLRSSDVIGTIVQKDARLVMQHPDSARAAGAVAHLEHTKTQGFSTVSAIFESKKERK